MKTTIKIFTSTNQLPKHWDTLAVENAPDNAEFKALDEAVKTQLDEFQLPSYKEYLEQEKKVKEMKQKQDSLVKANTQVRGTSVILDGPSGIMKK